MIKADRLGCLDLPLLTKANQSFKSVRLIVRSLLFIHLILCITDSSCITTHIMCIVMLTNARLDTVILSPPFSSGSHVGTALMALYTISFHYNGFYRLVPGAKQGLVSSDLSLTLDC